MTTDEPSLPPEDAVKKRETFGSSDSIDGLGLSLTQVQTDLVSRLRNYSNAAADAYIGALRVYYDRDYPYRASMFAYALRDVTDGIARESQDVEEVGQPLSRKRRKELLIKTIDSLTEQAYRYETHYEDLSGSYDYLSKISHRSIHVSDMDLRDHMERMEEILHEVTIPQSMINEKVDRIMHGERSLPNAKRLIRMITNGATQARIIAKLPVDWLRYMRDAGYFDNIYGEKHWGAHMYIQRCADTDHEGAAGAIMSYETDVLEGDPRVYSDLLRYASGMPVDHVARISEHMLENEWYRMFWLDVDYYLRIVLDLYLDGRHGLATALLRAAFSVPAPVHDGMQDTEWARMQLGELVKRILEDPDGADPVPLLDALADILGYLIRMEHGAYMVRDGDSGMSSRRPSIEESEENWLDDLPSSVVGYVRDCLIAVGRGDPQRLRSIMDGIVGRPYQVWRRMEMAVYCHFPEIFKKEIEVHAVRYFRDRHASHENQVMLKRCFSGMSARTRRTILGMIRAAGDEQFERFLPRIGAERARRSADMLMLRYLESVRDCLDPEYRDTYTRLVKEYGNIENPERAVPERDESIKPEPKRETGFKDVDHAFEVMAGYVPGPVFPPDTLLRTFSDFVRKNPAEASKKASRLEGADPLVQAGFFDGLGNALDGKSKIDWEGIMPLMLNISRMLSEGGPESRRETARTICRMLKSAFSRDMPDIGFKDDLWEVVSMLASAAVTDDDDYEADFKNGRDGHTISINNLDGLSFHALVLYAIWAARNGGEPSLDSGVRNALDKYVDDWRIHTVSRSSVLGVYLIHLYNLHKGWTVDMAKRIRGSSTKAAFWDAYVRSNPPYVETFRELYSLYSEFLIGKAFPGLRRTKTFNCTFDHVLPAYLAGIEGSGKMVGGFLKSINKKAPEEMIDHCVFSVKTMVKGIYGDPKFDCKMLEPLWNHPVFSRRDLTGWFVGSKMDRGWSIRMYSQYAKNHHETPRLTYHLLDELRSYAGEFPEEVATALCRLVENPLNYHQAKAVDEIMAILERHRHRIGGMLDRITEIKTRNSY